MEEMEDNGKNRPSDENVQEQPTSRRRLLKKIALTTGTLGASFLLPVKWSQPLIDTVFLPAHAQTSAGSLPDPDIRNFSLATLRSGFNGPDPKSASPKEGWYPTHSGDFDYTDALCQVDGNTILNYNVIDGGELVFQSGVESGQTLSAIGASIGGNSCSGNIGFNFYTNAFGKTLEIRLTVNGRQSTWINSSTAIPGPIDE